MSGFKNFLLRGNLIELAVAFIMGGAFATVVSAFVAMIMDVIGKAGGSPNFSSYQPGGIHVGDFITAIVALILLGAIVYFGIVMPYTAAKARYFPATDEPGTPEDVALLTEIRDLRAERQQV